MKHVRKLLIILCIVLSVNNSYSQKFYRMVNLNFTGGQPTGGLSNFIDDKILAGLSLEGKYFINDKVTLGISTGWNAFNKKLPREVYNTENGEISAVQTRFFRSIPILLTTHYFFNIETESKLKPYIGIGAGAYQIRYVKWYGAFATGKEKWSLGVQPEAGILVPFGQKLGINANIRYNHAFYSYDEISSLSFLEGSAGIFYRFF